MEYDSLILHANKQKLYHFEALKTNKLEKFRNVCVELKYDSTQNKLAKQIEEEALIGIYKVRELKTKLYSNRSYANHFMLAQKENDSIANNVIKAIDFIVPVSVYDFNKSLISHSSIEPPSVK